MSTYEMLGAYYLHTNSELIWKNAIVFANDREYFDSPFVQKVWYIPNDDTIKGIVITMLKEAHKLGANKKSIIEIAKEMCLTRKELGIELGKNT